MPVGPFGEIHGTTGTLDGLSEAAQHYKSKVVAPRNPKVVRGGAPKLKVRYFLIKRCAVFINLLKFIHDYASIQSEVDNLLGVYAILQ